MIRIPDLDIYRADLLYLERHGDKALTFTALESDRIIEQGGPRVSVHR